MFLKELIKDYSKIYFELIKNFLKDDLRHGFHCTVFMAGFVFSLEKNVY